MITIIASTNRRKSDTLVFAKKFKAFFDQLEVENQLLNLEDLPVDFIHPDMYTKEGQSKGLLKFQKKYILSADKFFFVLPEYNGGMPGILKLFIDACSVYEIKHSFYGKKAALAGIATGRAGNLRGIEHLTGILNFLGVTVMPNRVPFSSIMHLYDEEGEIVDTETLEVMEALVNQFIAF